MKSFFLSIFIFLSFFTSRSQTANISGIINSYTSVTSIGSQSVSVSSATGFNVADRVLLIQMKGATINTSNNSSFGTILSYNDAGNYELATVASVSGSTITFSSPLSRTYTSGGFVQLVKVPSYTNVNVAGLLTCSPWNGTTGGILAFEASGTITLNANVDVSGKGFLGGALSNGAITGCAADTFDFVLPSGSAASALKGEGIVNPNVAMADGKGAWANGGGSGNDCNGGGAGGGNYGLGGHGGDPKVNVSCPPYFYQNSGGNSGKNLVYSNASNKIFMGGGGGAGHQNNAAGSAGVSGGGIVLFRGSSITGNNNYIKANGTDNNVVAGIDGQGGGGAGGTVLIDVCSINSLNVSVTGGKGGVDNFTGSDCHGKGGGGAGGIIWVSPTTITGLTPFLTGGLPGVFTSPSCLCFNTSNGATQGGIGGTLTGLIVPGAPLMNTPSAVKDTTVCTNGPVQLTAPAASSYSWSTGSVNQSISVNAPGTYWVQLNPQSSCSSATDTFHVIINTPPIINLIHDSTLCSNTTYSLNESAANASTYVWSTGSLGPSINVVASGIYWVDMNINQCLVRDSATITILSSPVVIAPNYSVCSGQSVNVIPSVFGGTGALTYNWGNGNTNSFYTTVPLADSIYSVIVTDANGCGSAIASGNITVFPPLNVVTNGITTCSFDTVSLLATASGGNGNYVFTWAPSGSNQNPFSVVPQNTTIYTVTVSDGCSINNATDTARITIIPAPSIVMPTSISGCVPVCVDLTNTAYSSLSTWQWNFGDNSSSNSAVSSHCYSNSGNFNISLSYTTASGCVKTVSSNSIVTVFPFPEAAFSASAFETDIFNTEINFYNQSTGYVSSQWDFGDLSGSSAQNPSHLYQAINNYPVTLIVQNSFGCIDTVIHEIIIHDIFTFYAPGAFSPNSDQINDVFLPTGTGWDNSTFKLWVFDRWGELITSTVDAYKGWDGMLKREVVQEDTYVWKVELKDVYGKKHSYSGIVSVIK